MTTHCVSLTVTPSAHGPWRKGTEIERLLCEGTELPFGAQPPIQRDIDIYMERGSGPLAYLPARATSLPPVDSSSSDQIGGGGIRYVRIDGRNYIELPPWPVTITRTEKQPGGGR